jgi:hypothetical protein
MSVTHASDAQHGHDAWPFLNESAHAGHAHQAVPMYYTAAPNAFNRFFLALYEKSPRWMAPAAVLVCFLSAAAFVWVWNPTDAGANSGPTCIIKMTTGFDCPGCGGTRAFYYLMHGNIPEAARHHAMAVFAAPFLVWLYVAWAVKTVWGKQIPVPTISARTISFFIAAWGVFMVIRNIPVAPFTSLYV